MSEDEAKKGELWVSDYEMRDANWISEENSSWIEVKEDFVNNGPNLKVKVERDEMVEEDTLWGIDLPLGAPKFLQNPKPVNPWIFFF